MMLKLQKRRNCHVLKSRKWKLEEEEEGQTPKVAKVSNSAAKEASSGVVKTRPTRSNPSGKIIEKPKTPAEPKPETSVEPKPESSWGYQMPKSLSEKIIDSWFDQHYAHSFSGFLKSLNETEAGVVREILLGKDNLASSGQFSDVTTQEESFAETNNVSTPIQTDGTKEKKKCNSNIDNL